MDRDAAKPAAWRLPARLREVSGLALSPDGRLFAVADESAVIYQIDYEEGRIVKAFGLGNPVVRGDFEGIAHAAGRLWLITSGGDLYAAAEGGDGEHVSYSVQNTGFGDRCEIEGLAWSEPHDRLLVLCKDMRGGGKRAAPAIYGWDIAAERPDEDVVIRLPMDSIDAAAGEDRLRPSGIAVDPASGGLVVIAAREHLAVELDGNGEFVAVIMLAGDRHPQAEGVEITPDGRLLIADEGGKGAATLTVYAALEEERKHQP